ncbi:MAG: hypothetical protein ACP5KO_06620 [Caldimicrobium sp.]|jgi:hypothetical protein
MFLNIKSCLLVLFLLLGFIFLITEKAFSQEIDLESYDPNTEIILKGEIKEIIIPEQGMVSIIISKGEKLYRAYLCPRWFYFQLNPNLKPGEMVEIKGAKIYTRRQGLVLVVRVLKNLTTKEEVVIRDFNCKPCWRGKRW